MGTSSSHGGPTGSSPLLPPWAPPLDPEPDAAPDDGDGGDGDGQNGGQDEGDQRVPPDLREPPTWQGLKRQTTLLAGSGATGGTARRRARSIARNYVRRSGGASRAAQGSVAGRQTARRVGGFLSDVARSGVVQAFRNANLAQYLGGSVDDLLAGFAEAFLPPPNSLEDAAAREAGLQAFYDLLEQYDALDEGIEALDELDVDGIEHAIEHFISRYICSSALVMLSQRIENGSINVERCEEIEQTLRAVIIETVRLDFRNVDVVNIDWNGEEARRLVDRLMLDAYRFVEEE